MNARRAGCAVSILTCLVLGTSARAQVPGEEIARRAFQEGVVLEKKGEYAAALAKFNESEQIKATLGNRYHKAFCLEMTDKLAAAATEYEALERAARETKKTELAAAARARLEPLRAKVPTLAVTIPRPAPKDLEAELDGAALTPALLDGTAFRIDPGEHVVTARAPDHEPFTRRFTASEGGTSTVDVVLPPKALEAVAPTPGPPPARAHEPAPGRSRALPIATTAGAIVLAGAGVGAYMLAGQKEEALEQGPMRTFDALALGSWIGAAGLAALSVVLWTSSPRAAAEARVTVRSSWVGLEGRF
jgi:hypothetical protein